MTGACQECNSSLGCFSNTTACYKCAKILCSHCAGRWPLIPFDASNPEDSNNVTKNGTIRSFCQECFQDTSLLDFSKTYDVVHPNHSTGGGTKDDVDPAAVVTFIMVHGGGGSRAMFRPYADLLSQKGYRSILLDLPGHGSMVQTPLTLDSCVKTVQDVLEEMKLVKKKTIYVGGSLGAYCGFYVLDKLKDRFGGAILMDCGQNVGPGCSQKANFGLWFLRALASYMSNKGLMGAMLSVTKKSPASWKIIESTFGAGMFFDQAAQQVECLHTVAPADHIASYEFPVIFFNGSEDHRDSEEKWLSLCQDQNKSYLKVYEGGDHFFTHDARFCQDVIDRMDKFAALVAA